ncbi:MAG: hypothetical protein AB7Y46_06755 [Armatimonadota bacterium]
MLAAQALLVAGLTVWLVVLQRDLGWPGEWAWPVHGTALPLSFLLPPALALAGFGGLIAYLWRLLRREQIPAHRRGLAWSLAVSLPIAAWCVQVALWSVAPGSVTRLAAIQLSDVSTGYLAEAWRIDDLGAYLRSYAAQMPHKPEHVATHPPGAVLFFYAVRKLAAAVPALADAALVAGSTAIGLSISEMGREVARFPTTVWLGAQGLATAVLASWLLGAAGALMPLIVFAALRQATGNERALGAAALLALTPSMLLFFPLLDQLVGLLSALLIAALAATQRHWAWSVAGGLIVMAAVFVSLGALALAATGGIFLLLRAARQAGQSGDTAWSDTRSVFVPVLGFAGGLLAGLALWYAAGVDAIGVFSAGLGAHSGITGLASFRSYGVWVWLNLVEFAVFLGLPLAAVVVAAVPRTIDALRGVGGRTLPAYLLASGLLTLLLLDVSGLVKGETGRIWLFFAPWLVAGAAPMLLDEDAPDLRPLAITCALTALQLLLMAWTMQPIVRPY